MNRPRAATFHCIDAHTCGNPVRLVYRGAPPLEGATMLDRQQHFVREFDWIRTALMYEPRGHAMMSGGFLYPSAREDCDIGVLFIETSGCLPMCGHGTIGIVTIAIENGLVTRVVVFGRETARQLLGADVPAVLKSSKVAVVADLDELATHGTAKQALWKLLDPGEAGRVDG